MIRAIEILSKTTVGIGLNLNAAIFKQISGKKGAKLLCLKSFLANQGPRLITRKAEPHGKYFQFLVKTVVFHDIFDSETSH